ncbi:MAG TPA: amidohydrolase [Vicinamibacterales bacterium]|nr:amidohydrolase [Vicinamibacterales bacterium]
MTTIVNGRVWTGDAARPWAEAVALQGDRIAAVGSTKEIRARAGAGREIDARGGLVTPGFIDSHIHLLAGGFRLTEVQLRRASSREALARTLRSFAEQIPDGAWITGGDWDHEQWGGELPSRTWIDQATPRHPVWVSRFDGHMALANSLALREAGLSRQTADVDGGTIVRGPDGDPTGLLKDNAMKLVGRVVPRPPQDLEDRALDAGMRYVAARGVTSVHHMGSVPPSSTWADVEVFRRALDAGRLRTRIYATVPLPAWRELHEVVSSRDFGGHDGQGDEWLRIGALKGFVDGSLGSRTAAFHEPYADASDNIGLLVHAPEELGQWITDADRHGLHPVVHAIGDRANTLLLDLFEAAVARNGPRDRRFRIEHAQHLRRTDIPRFARLGVIASMQPYHAIDDGRWAERAIGSARAETTYACRSLLDAGATIVFGSDWFVAPPAPLEGLYAAITRRTLDDRHADGWVPSQRISLEEALRAYTVSAAYASFEESIKGQLSPGLVADVVVLDRDLFAMPPAEVRDARVMATVAGGTIVHEA